MLKTKVVLEATEMISVFAGFTKILVILSIDQSYFCSALVTDFRGLLTLLLLLTPPPSPESPLANSSSGS